MHTSLWMLYPVQLILPAAPVYFIWTETILCQSPKVPTLALTAWPPRLCNHRNQDSLYSSKEHPRPHGQGTQLPHHSFHVLQGSVQVWPQTGLFKCKCIHQKKLLSWRLAIWFNSIVQWVNPCSFLFLAERKTKLGTIHSSTMTDTVRKNFAFTPLKALCFWVLTEVTELIMKLSIQQLKLCHLAQKC